MRLSVIGTTILISFLMFPVSLPAQETTGIGNREERSRLSPEDGDLDPTEEQEYTLYDDRTLLDDYANKFADLSKEILLALIKDDTLTSYKSSAAIRIFKEKYAKVVVGREKKVIEKILLRRLARSDSAFVQVEIMHTLTILDRYRYFKSMIPKLIQKLDHYNSTVNEMAYNSLNDLIEEGNNRTREARIVFNTLRKVLFLSRKRLASITEPGPKLQQKLKLLRWSIKVLGSQELKRLPKEVISLL